MIRKENTGTLDSGYRYGDEYFSPIMHGKYYFPVHAGSAVT